MQVEPNDLLLFAHVVDDGSFTQAALRLGLPKSTVSRRLAALEIQLGERLLLRTTRKFAVTDFGRSVLEHARPLGQLRREAPRDVRDHEQLVDLWCKRRQRMLELVGVTVRDNDCADLHASTSR